ncbi:GspS/AspS pilotin family protein [Vibrio sonorensis]|uniref:GspS/AspS pilotin family protein n=1 Tax=Vibrio sonorensis TaxID=1004316 RepID=UPI0008DA81A4|nr:GspS/AspS pilotin family protein [Vibrio sonorensis]
MKKWILFALISITLVGCSSTASEQRQLELIAANRASLLSAELPMEVGPLNIMRANAKGTSIEMMMVYNQDQRGAKPLTALMQHSINSYCTNPDTRANLDVGITYRLKVRNSRGQLMVDQLVNKQSCQAK